MQCLPLPAYGRYLLCRAGKGKVQKTTGQPIDRLSFVISAQVDLPRHYINIIERNRVLELLFCTICDF